MSRVIDAIKQDHRELRDYYQKIINASDEDTGTRWGNQFTWELARHSVAEELVVYPALESNIDHGKSLADKDRQEHQKIKELLHNFQKMSAKDKEFRPTIDIIMENLNKHIDEEEDEDLPSLESVLEQSESESLAKRFEMTKVLVPTRSHPSAPTQPFFESVVGLMTAPIDKISDIMRKFPEQ